MFKRIFRRNIRQPLSNIAVILFAAVLTVVLCYLHRAGVDEQRSFDEAYASVPVFCKITDLDGSSISAGGGLDGWVLDLFTDTKLVPNLSPYVRELHTRVSYYSAAQVYTVFDEERGQIEKRRNITLTGISSTRVAEELTAGWGGSIHWYDGYDESILQTREFVCIVPEELQELREAELEISYNAYRNGPDAHLTKEYITRTYQVAGYYQDPGNSRFYIPYPTMEWYYGQIGTSMVVEGFGAMLADNSQLDALRETAANWFAEPNPMGDPTPWGRFGYEYFLYALDIDDTMLKALAAEMKNSIRMNRLASTVVFLLSAGAGFLTGFLVIRSRKREIALMRTMGASHAAIYLELTTEQLLCIALGVLVGGSYALWQPIGKLCLFGGIYFVGLSVALLVFLRSNLLTTIKEDE